MSSLFRKKKRTSPLYQRKYRPAEPIKDFVASEPEPEGPDQIFGRALQAGNAGDYAKALEFYDYLLTISPEKYAYRNMRAVTLWFLGHREESYQLLQVLIDECENPHSKAAGLIERASLLGYEPEFSERALRDLDAAAELKPEGTSCQIFCHDLPFRRAEVCNLLGRHEDALAYAESALKVDPVSRGAAYQRRRALEALNLQ